jgi:hypothetical protein
MSIKSRFVSSLRSVADAVERNNTGEKIDNFVFKLRVKTADFIQPTSVAVLEKQYKVHQVSGS